MQSRVNIQHWLLRNLQEQTLSTAHLISYPTRKTDTVRGRLLRAESVSLKYTTMAKLSSCFKRLFIFFNLLFAIVGGVIIGLGLLGQFFYHGSTSEFENQTTGFVVLYVVGGVTMATSLLGVYGAHRGKRIPLIVFLLACIIGCFGLLRLAVPAAIYRPEVEQSMEEKFREVLPLNRASPDVRQLTERIQLGLKCCGLFSYTDWGQNVPDSCLCQGEEDQVEGKCQNIPYKFLFLSEKLIYKQTCFPILKGYMAKAMDIVLGVFFGFAVLSLLGAVMSAVLLAQVRRSTVGVPVVSSVSSQLSKFSFSYQPPKYSELYNVPEKSEKSEN